MFRDDRVFGTTRWSLYPPKDYAMQIPTDLLHVVVFLGQRVANGEELSGTGFIVSVPTESDPEHAFLYLVTARHCVEGKDNLIARTNAPPGMDRSVLTIDLPDGDDWYFHPNPGPGEDLVDLAVTPWPEAQDLFDAGYRFIPLSMFYDETMFGDNPTQGFGLADEVAAVGLFTAHQGRARNEPVVRTGNLAAIPQEPIKVDYGDDATYQRLFLTELRSIGGLSGSPVLFWHRSFLDEPTVPVSLLGVLSGHWEDNYRNHVGFGKVVPAPLLAEVLKQEELVALRKRDSEGPGRRPAAKPSLTAVDDSAQNEASGDDRVSLAGVSPDDALRALLKTPPQRQHGDA